MMKKIKNVFQFDENHHVIPAVNPECQWVIDGEGVATRKRDGTACAIINDRLYARYDCKPSKQAKKNHVDGTAWTRLDCKFTPINSIPCQPEPDAVTGHWPHWVLVKDQPEYKWQRVAMFSNPWNLTDGTYELCGPAINGNKEKLLEHVLIRHGDEQITDEFSRTFDGIRAYLETHLIEGIVFHHPDGRMAKIRRVDFGFEW